MQKNFREYSSVSMQAIGTSKKRSCLRHEVFNLKISLVCNSPLTNIYLSGVLRDLFNENPRFKGTASQDKTKGHEFNYSEVS